jgi:hypothetical protein
MVLWTGLIWLRIGTIKEGSRKDSTEPSGSVSYRSYRTAGGFPRRAQLHRVNCVCLYIYIYLCKVKLSQ